MPPRDLAPGLYFAPSIWDRTKSRLLINLGRTDGGEFPIDCDYFVATQYSGRVEGCATILLSVARISLVAHFTSQFYPAERGPRGPHENFYRSPSKVDIKQVEN